MDTYETASGLLVHDRRLHRVFDRDDVPNPNPPIGTVGPHTAAGEVVAFTPLPAGPTAALTPPGAQAWSGWPAGWQVPWSTGAGWSYLAGMSSLVFLCLDKNTSILSTMPPYLSQESGEVDGRPAWLTNPQPDVYSGWTEFLREVLAAWWLGEAFIWATSRYASGYPRTFVMLNPSWVLIEWDGGGRRYLLRGEDITADLLHLRYTTWPGELHGVGPLAAAAGPSATSVAVEQFTASLAARGGVPWAVLKHPATLTAKQTDELRARYVQARVEARVNGEDAAPLILSGGLDLQPLAVSVQDLALLDIAKMSESRLALLLGVPPSLVGLPTGQDSLTYNNAAEFRLQHWQIDLKPKAAIVMEALSNWLLPRGTKLELDRDEYVRPAFVERVQGYSTLFAIVDPVTGERGITIDEIRKLERLTGPQMADPAALAAASAPTPADDEGGPRVG